MPGNPRGKGRPRFNKGHAMTPNSTREYERVLASLWKGGEPITEPVQAIVTAYYYIPKSTSKKNRAKMLSGEIRPTKIPDIDNVVKIVLDALNGIAYADDKQILEVHAYKYYSEIPRVEVEIEVIDTKIE